MPAARGATAAVIKYLQKHARLQVWLGEIAEDVGLEEKPVQNVMSALIRDGYLIDVAVRGQSWIYRGPAVAAGQQDGVGTCLEVIAVKRDGSLILKSTSDEIYVATVL